MGSIEAEYLQNSTGIRLTSLAIYLADNETLKKSEEVDESEVKAIQEEFGLNDEKSK